MKAAIHEHATRDLFYNTRKLPPGVKGTLDEKACFMIRKKGSGKVLAVRPYDKYHPRETGVYNIHLVDEEEDKRLSNPKRVNQLWYYNKREQAFLSRKFPTMGIFEGFNSNMIVYKYNGVRNQKW